MHKQDNCRVMSVLEGQANGKRHGDKLVQLNSENSDALLDVMMKYDEMSVLMTEAGHDTSALQPAIRAALGTTVVLLAVTNDILHA